MSRNGSQTAERCQTQLDTHVVQPWMVSHKKAELEAWKKFITGQSGVAGASPPDERIWGHRKGKLCIHTHQVKKEMRSRKQ